MNWQMPTANSLEPYWMPFTANRQFKAHPRMIARAEGMYYYTDRGDALLDGSSGLFCVAAGHGRHVPPCHRGSRQTGSLSARPGPAPARKAI